MPPSATTGSVCFGARNVTLANMFGFNRNVGIVERDANLGAPGIGVEDIADEQDVALEDFVADRR